MKILIIVDVFTTPRHCIPDRQIRQKNDFHRQKVGQERVFPTDNVCHRKSSREIPFPTDNILPTDCWMAIAKLSWPTYSFPTSISLPTNILCRPTNGQRLLCRPTFRWPYNILFPTNSLSLFSFPTNIQLALCPI